MADRIRFTLLEDGEDVRPYDFDTETVQIGADPGRGDNLLINLPPRLRHVRAKIFRSSDYVELEVKAGPIWLQGSKMEEGDVAELNVGDILIFGTKKPRGVRLRFEYAKEAEIFMDDVADWTVSASPKKGRGNKTAEDDFAFEEEVDPTEGMNPYQKAVYKYRQLYGRFTKWRKKAARIKYWTSTLGILWQKAGKFAAVGIGIGIPVLGFLSEKGKREDAEEQTLMVEEREAQAVRDSLSTQSAMADMSEQMRQCGCGDGGGAAGAGEFAAAEAMLERFGEGDDAFNPMMAVNLPNQTVASLSSLLNGPITSARRNKTILPTVMNRVCSPMGDKERMRAVQVELANRGLHEAYSFVPFVESQWCELAVSPTGPRGMMQFTRATAVAAFGAVDPRQADIPHYDFDDHRQFLTSKSKRYGGYYGMLAACPEDVKLAYRQKYYDGKTSAEFPDRVDPADPRTDWKWAVKAAFHHLEILDRYYRERGFREVDAIMLAMTAYNQGRGMVATWMDAAKKNYGIERDAALTYVHVYGGGIKRLQTEKNPVQVGRIKEGMRYAPKIMGYYLVAAKQLDARQCRD